MRAAAPSRGRPASKLDPPSAPPPEPESAGPRKVEDGLKASMAPDELRAALRTLGYRTQNELAAAIGVSRSAVSLWLEGKVGVPRPVAMLLRMLIAAQRRAY
jgi:DNA-binding XRE family transcriptional regulator